MPETMNHEEKREQLEAERAAAEATIEEAERQLGAAALDGADVEQVEEKLTGARAVIRRVGHALGELGDREAVHAEREQEKTRAAQRAAFYRWQGEYLRRLAPLVALREQVEAAERHLAELRRPREPRSLFAENASPWDDLEGGEYKAARRLPRSSMGPRLGFDPTVEHLSGDDRFERLATRMDELADAEAARSDAEKVRAAAATLPESRVA